MNIKNTFPACLLLFSFLAINPVMAQWRKIPLANASQYESMQFFDAKNGIASSTSNILKTNDGGENWISIDIYGIRDIDFINPSIGYAAGVSGSALYKTNDGGSTWASLTPVNSNSLWGVSVVDANTVFVCGTGGVVWKSTDGGSNFYPVDLPTGDLAVDLQFSSATAGCVLGQSGKIWQTKNAGLSWTNTFSIKAVLFTELYFVDALNGYAVGSGGTIVKTTDGGANWILLTSGSSGYLQSVHFYDTNNGIAVGYGGVILHTINGGSTWVSETSGTTGALMTSFMLSPAIAIAAGDNGLMLKKSNMLAGIEQIALSDNFSVYPNPNNGSFTVSSFKQQSHLTEITINDILGNEVFSKFTNTSDQSAVVLNNTPAGIYFIHFRCGNAVCTKKIILQ
jgi:photosystem II stability/assembly factor-like uncharacterized protein